MAFLGRSDPCFTRGLELAAQCLANQRTLRLSQNWQFCSAMPHIARRLMMERDNDLRIRPGRICSTRVERTRPISNQVLAATRKAGGQVTRKGSVTGLPPAVSVTKRPRPVEIRTSTDRPTSGYTAACFTLSKPPSLDFPQLGVTVVPPAPSVPPAFASSASAIFCNSTIRVTADRSCARGSLIAE